MMSIPTQRKVARALDQAVEQLDLAAAYLERDPGRVKEWHEVLAAREAAQTAAKLIVAALASTEDTEVDETDNVPLRCRCLPGCGCSHRGGSQ